MIHRFILVILLVANFGPIVAEAAAKPIYSVWIPYWKKTTGTAETLAHISQLNEVSPFSYTVKSNGAVVDTAKLNQEPWLNLFASAKLKKIKIIPAINWADDQAIYNVMASSTLRLAHENQIISLIQANNFDGVDIDYENKTPETRVYFSKFIKELYLKLAPLKKELSCTVEARTPVASRFTVVPKDIEYANDYAVLNSYCNQVRIISYDQARVDIVLNKKKARQGFYAPVADLEWVKKVVAEANKYIVKRKIMLGVATYGYEYEVNGTGQLADYREARSLNYQDFLDLAKNNNAMPRRDLAGELSFIYATATSTRLAVFSDSVAIADKIKLARTLGLRGVAIFKIDGASDPLLWGLIK